MFPNKRKESVRTLINEPWWYEVLRRAIILLVLIKQAGPKWRNFSYMVLKVPVLSIYESLTVNIWRIMPIRAAVN